MRRDVVCGEMKVRKLNQREYQELVWPEVSLAAMDFRDTFPGDLVNMATLINPEPTVSETQAVLEHHTREIAMWIRSHRKRFNSGDRFQIIVGWPTSVRATGRQIIKMGGDVEAIARIADGTTSVVPHRGWTIQVFEGEKTEP